MKHSNQGREFPMTEDGIKLVDASIGPAGVLTGSARIAGPDAERARVLATTRSALAKQRGMGK